jgi:hypothetical protein
MSDAKQGITPGTDPWLASRRDFSAATLDELADYAAISAPDKMMARNVRAEIERRQMIGQIETLQATKIAAEATRDAAIYSKASAKWMKWSTIIAACSAFVAAAATICAVIVAFR